MTKESARKRAIYRSIFAYRGRSTARATVIRRHPLEGRSHLFSPEVTATLLTRSVLTGRTDLVTKCRNALYMRCAAEQRAILVWRADTWGAVP